MDTIIQYVGLEQNNNLFIKRDDLIPISFGGNKARKAQLFFKEIDEGDYDCIVTYGSFSSNHCRVISNMAASRGMKCYIISPKEVSEKTFNSRLMLLFGAEITTIPVELVHDTIERKILDLKNSGKKPYFIPGGGHGNLGTQAYVECYKEIKNYETNNDIHFDYIFHASGTGTTQAGLICGQLLSGDDRKIIGISIARKKPYGRDVILESVREYLGDQKGVEEATIFEDSYIGDGYSVGNLRIEEMINNVLIKHSIPLDIVYTGKAYYGMMDYIKTNNIVNKNILFLHTGGTPLFFDYLENTKI